MRFTNQSRNPKKPRRSHGRNPSRILKKAGGRNLLGGLSYLLKKSYNVIGMKIRKTIEGKCKQCATFYRRRLDRANLFCSVKCYGVWQSLNLIGEKNPFYGKKHSEKTKIALRKRIPTRYWLGKSRSKETKEKLRVALQGNNSSLWKGGISKVPGYTAFHSRRRQVRKLLAEGTHTQKEWFVLKTKYNFICFCCNRKEPEIRLTEDHIIPLIKNGNDFIDNIQPLCQSCNSKKGLKIIKYEPILSFISTK